MEITYRIPSKKVPYGYLEFTMKEGDTLPDPVELADSYASYILSYQTAEVVAFENPGHLKVKAKPSPEKETAAAINDLNEGLGGVTEIDEDEPVAPWNKGSEDKETEAKPWDAGNDSDWTF